MNHKIVLVKSDLISGGDDRFEMFSVVSVVTVLMFVSDLYGF